MLTFTSCISLPSRWTKQMVGAAEYLQGGACPPGNFASEIASYSKPRPAVTVVECGLLPATGNWGPART